MSLVLFKSVEMGAADGLVEDEESAFALPPEASRPLGGSRAYSVDTLVSKYMRAATSSSRTWKKCVFAKIDAL